MSSTTSLNKSKSTNSSKEIWALVSLFAMVGVFFVGSITLLWLSQTPFGTPLAQSAKLLFATDSVQAWWYVTRASGLTAYFLLWLSMVWGLAIPSKFFQSVLEGTFSYDFHEFLSLLGLGFVALHVIVLLFDQFLPFNLLQIFIPFIDTYRPLWVGLGIMGSYLLIIVTVTFYLRKFIGSQAFRSIHTLSLLGYLSATLHGLFAGTDSALPFAKLLYVGTFLVVFFLTVYWLVVVWFKKDEEHRQELLRTLEANRRRRAISRRA